MSFWKESRKNVPGRPSPHKESSWSKPKGTGGTSSFQDFDASVRDAWDINDDEFSVMSEDLKISEAAAQIAALNVINNHRTTSNRSGEDGTGNDDEDEHERPNAQLTGPPVHQGSQPQSSPTKKQSNSNNSNNSNQPSPRHQPSTPKTFIHSSHQSAGITKSKVISRIESERERQKADKIRTLLKSSSIELKDLQSLSYSGLPYSIRGTAWKVLAGYLPTNGERRNEVLARKREEYWNCVKQYYDSRLDEGHQDTFRQIHIDIPRMCPLIALFQQPVVQEMFERILFIWAIRHPASGYVQGMNDLVTPFFVVFLEEVLPPHIEVETFDVTCLPENLRNSIEADSYWCMSKFLDSIQVNYIFAQTGIQEKVRKLKELIERIDAPLNQHLKTHEIDYLQFSFRWMNNLLMRELPLRCTVRLWDTYLAEPDGCGSVLLYVCAAFLCHWRKELIEQKDFQGLMLLLQNLPTQGWESEDISLIVAEAYRLKYTFDSAPKHLGGGSTK